MRGGGVEAEKAQKEGAHLCRARGLARPGWRWGGSESEAQRQFKAAGVLEANPPLHRPQEG